MGAPARNRSPRCQSSFHERARHNQTGLEYHPSMVPVVFSHRRFFGAEHPACLDALDSPKAQLRNLPIVSRHVNTTSPHSRWTAPLIFILICSFLFLGVVLLRDKRTRPLAEIPPADDTHPHTPESFTPAPIHQPHITYIDAPPPIQATTTTPSPAIDARLAAYLKPPWQDAYIPTGARSTTFGIVDLYRLVAAHPPDTNSPDARASLLRDIRDSIATRAHAHGFSLVLDISANSSFYTPFVLATNGPVDITAEVLEDLSQ